MNFLEGKVMEDGYFVCGDHKVGISKLKVPTPKFNMLKEQKYIEKPIILGIRPEDIHDEKVVLDTYDEAHIKLKVDVAELLGAETLIYAAVNTQPIVAKVNARVDVHMGDELDLAFDMNKSHFFDIDTELRIKKN